MKVELNIKDDRELRNAIRDMIRGEVRGVVRSSITEIMREEIEKEMGRRTHSISTQIDRSLALLCETIEKRRGTLTDDWLREQVRATIRERLKELFSWGDVLRYIDLKVGEAVTKHVLEHVEVIGKKNGE